MKKEIKIGLSTILLIISIIIIIIMAYSLYKLNFQKLDMITYEKDLNAKISKLEEITKEKENENNNSNKQIETEVSKTSKMSFSEIMDMMYTKNDTIIEGNNVSIYPKCNTNMIYQDETGKMITQEYTEIMIIDGEISFDMNKVEPEKKISTTITGITEEVVSIKIVQVEGGATPLVIYFLTRNGNVYYVNQDMIYSNNFIAEKITTLKEIVSIEIACVICPGDLEGTTTLIATTYEGKKINVSK